MISFRSMTEKEYPDFLAYFISDYATEIQTNYRLSRADSLERATHEITETLVEGVNTHGHELLCIFNQFDLTDKHIGYLWYKTDTLMKSVFIYDFHIFDACQGMGLGKQTLCAFEDQLRDKGFKEIRLRVAGDNARARHIYESCGFGVTGINMNKSIAHD
jgi:ribosomal protein S18 acetylase RimI-like enzyme